MNSLAALLLASVSTLLAGCVVGAPDSPLPVPAAVAPDAGIAPKADGDAPDSAPYWHCVPAPAPDDAGAYPCPSSSYPVVSGENSYAPAPPQCCGMLPPSVPSCVAVASPCSLDDGGAGSTEECTFPVVESAPGWLKAPTREGDCAAAYVVLDSGTVGYCCP